MRCAVLFDLILYVPANNLSVTSGRVFLGWTNTCTKLGLMCLAQGHNGVMPVKHEPAALRSQVKHSGAQWLSGRVLDLRLKGCQLETHWRHGVVSSQEDWKMSWVKNCWLERKASYKWGYRILKEVEPTLRLPKGFWGAGKKGYLFSGSWGALVTILGQLGSKHILLENKGACTAKILRKRQFRDLGRSEQYF